MPVKPADGPLVELNSHQNAINKSPNIQIMPTNIFSKFWLIFSAISCVLTKEAEIYLAKLEANISGIWELLLCWFSASFTSLPTAAYHIALNLVPSRLT